MAAPGLDVEELLEAVPVAFFVEVQQLALDELVATQLSLLLQDISDGILLGIGQRLLDQCRPEDGGC